MKHLINVRVYRGITKTHSLDNIECTYEENKQLMYTDEFGKHTIDIKNKIYQKSSPEGLMKVDFNTNEFYIQLASKEELSFEVDCSLEVVKETITLKYSLGEETIKIVVIVKE